MTLIQLLQAGGALRYKPHSGFYVVKGGEAIQIGDDEARRAVNARQVLPAGIAGPGVYVFKLNTKAAHAMPAVRRHPQALPKRTAAVPPALPDVPALRCQAGAEIPAPVSADGGAAPGPVPAGAGRLDGAGAQRERVAGAGKEHCVGCGASEGKGVTA